MTRRTEAGKGTHFLYVTSTIGSMLAKQSSRPTHFNKGQLVLLRSSWDSYQDVGKKKEKQLYKNQEFANYIGDIFTGCVTGEHMSLGQ